MRIAISCGHRLEKLSKYQYKDVFASNELASPLSYFGNHPDLLVKSHSSLILVQCD